MIYTFVGLIDLILRLVMYLILFQVIMSWLVAFNVLNTSSEGMRNFLRGLERITEPLYRPFRRILPDFGGIDFAPLLVVIIIMFIREALLPGILMEVGPTVT